VAPLDELLLGELEPHAAASKATMPSTATPPILCLTFPPLPGAADGRPGRAAGFLAQPLAGQGEEVPNAPPDLPKVSPDAAVREA
jgi:hypothetical protein